MLKTPSLLTASRLIAGGNALMLGSMALSIPITQYKRWMGHKTTTNDCSTQRPYIWSLGAVTLGSWFALTGLASKLRPWAGIATAAGYGSVAGSSAAALGVLLIDDDKNFAAADLACGILSAVGLITLGSQAGALLSSRVTRWLSVPTAIVGTGTLTALWAYFGLNFQDSLN